MIEFFFFVLIIFSAVWGSIFLASIVRPRSRDLSANTDDALLFGVREEIETVLHRLARVEEELEFFRELRAPEQDLALPAGDEGGETQVDARADAPEGQQGDPRGDPRRGPGGEPR